MFRFDFAQTLDYPIDAGDDEQLLRGDEDALMDGADSDGNSVREEGTSVDDVIVIPAEEEREEPPKPFGQSQRPCQEISLDDLIRACPPVISYTPIIVPAASSEDEDVGRTRQDIIIPRRDLYDARFQIISGSSLEDHSDSEDSEEDLEGVMEIEPPTITSPIDEHPRASALSLHTLPGASRGNEMQTDTDTDTLAFIDAPSDLIPNVYEGGLKTWECSLDVVDYLSRHPLPSRRGGRGRDADPLSNTSDPPRSFRGRAILEVGCGTAMPTAFILKSLLDFDGEGAEPTILHLQDYNRSVLELVTLPNLLLAWYYSKSGEPYRSIGANASTEEEQNDGSTARWDPTFSAELAITPSLLAEFKKSLKSHNIQLRFWAGSWTSFVPSTSPPTADEAGARRPFDLVITCETIYRSANLIALLDVLKAAARPTSSPHHALTIDEPVQIEDAEPIILVAAKVLYFGVGGSVDEFERMAKQAGARDVSTVMEVKLGVGRKVLKVVF